jgi:hypothetical protein
MPGSCPASRTLDPAPWAHYPTLFVSPLSWYTVPDAKVIFCFLPPISPSLSNCCNTLDQDWKWLSFHGNYAQCLVCNRHIVSTTLTKFTSTWSTPISRSTIQLSDCVWTDAWFHSLCVFPKIFNNHFMSWRFACKCQNPKPELEELLKAKTETESANFRGPVL